MKKKVPAKSGFLALLAMLFVFALQPVNAEPISLDEIAKAKIDTLKVLMNEATIAGVDTYKEKLTVRTAEVFLFYADWDENHVAENEASFKLVSRYKNNALEMAQLLPDFQRNDVILMLDESLANLKKLISGEITRKPTPKVSWATAKHQNDQITFANRPVFMADYTWKPSMAGSYDLTEFFGDLDGYYMDPNHVNENGSIKTWKLNELKDKGTGTLGFIFFGNKQAPDWAEEKYGPGFQMREDTYTGYDIDNPGARELLGNLVKGTVPYMKGKKFSELGYMLCNEPHFYTTKTKKSDGTYKLDWASGPVSEYTFVKFRTWLAEKHENIEALNTLWGTSFEAFDSVKLDIPMSRELIGDPIWYDWQCFNNYRVTEWYKWLKSEIRKYDSEAKIHLKVMPNLWSGNNRGHGIDMEAITDLSEIVGNDAGADHSPMWGEPYEWQTYYAFEWREMSMSFDFYRSIAPNKINLNSEAHYLSTGRSRDLYLDPAFSRASYWLATTQGLTASQVWFWPKDNNGKPRENEKGYGGSNSQQPRVTHELHSTIMDLNTFGEEIMTMQRQKKPVRIYYSETSALNKTDHMDDVFELYESMVFDGIPLGFATKNVISTQDHKNWSMILVYNTPYVTNAEFDTLQSYLNNGGTILLDNVSLKKDEYGRTRTKTLEASSGSLLSVNTATAMHTMVKTLAQARGFKPEVSITEKNSFGTNKHKGCIWKCIKNEAGNNVLSIVNVGKSNATLEISLTDAVNGTHCTNLLTGESVSANPIIKPLGVLFLEVTDELGVRVENQKEEKMATLYPNPSNGNFNIAFNKTVSNLMLEVYSLAGVKVLSRKFSETDRISQHLLSQPSGTYIVRVKADGKIQNRLFVKQ